MEQEHNVGKRFSREKFGLGKLGTALAIVLVVAVIVWVIYASGFLG